MKCFKYFAVIAAFSLCNTVSAQFSNVNSRTSGSSGLDGNGPKAGYKGFVDVGYTVGLGDNGVGRIAFSTTHGYQINPYVFVGAGAGVNCYTQNGSTAWGIPIFADARANFLNNSISPFLDVKIGYSVADISGFYFSPSIGCRFGLSSKVALTLSIGYEMQRAEFYYYYSYGRYSYGGSAKANCGGLVLRTGIEF